MTPSPQTMYRHAASQPHCSGSLANSSCEQPGPPSLGGSHCSSGGCTVPLPQSFSLQSALQPSPPVVLPSSHASMEQPRPVYVRSSAQETSLPSTTNLKSKERSSIRLLPHTAVRG